MFFTYDDGFKAGKQDAKDGLRARASRTWKRAYMDGYSDGYMVGSKVKNSW